MIEGISAITLATHNMSRAVRFYRILGFEVVYGGDYTVSLIRVALGSIITRATKPFTAGRPSLRTEGTR